MGATMAVNEYGEKLCRDCNHPVRQHVGSKKDAVCWGEQSKEPPYLCQCKKGLGAR